MNRREMIRESLRAAVAAALLPRAGVAQADRLPGTPGAATPILGINSNVLRPEEVAQLAELGIRHARLPGILQLWEETERHRVDMRNMSRWASEAGIRILWYLHNIPEGHALPARARDRGRWMERMTRFAEWTARLPATEGVQLWNEVDQWVQMPFGAADDVSFEERGRRYADQLALAYPRIKAANPRVLVVSSGTADYAANQGGAPFLRGMLSERPPLDAVGVHAYGVWSRARELVLEARSVVAGRAPIWITEFGNDRPERYTEEHHLATWRTTIEGNEREGLAARMYAYALPTDPRAPGHGLLTPRGAPRATYRWLRDRRG